MRAVMEFRALTGLRGIAALGVALWHLGFLPTLAKRLDPAVFNGYLFVDLFFVLSGFVLSYVYDTAQSLRNRSAYTEFLVSRLSRIYPMHLVGLLFVALVECMRLFWGWAVFHPDAAAFSGTNQPKYLLTNLALVQAWGLHHDQTWNGPSWSISAEWACYLLFPWVLAGRRWSRSVTLAWLVAAGLLIPWWLTHRYGRMTVSTDWGVLRAFCGFSVGCLVQQHRELLLRHMLALARAEFWQVLSLLAFACVMSPHVTDSPIVMVSALVVLAFSMEEGIIARLVGAEPIHYLGMISYSVYMLHVPLFLCVIGFMQGMQWTAWVAANPGTVILLLLSILLILSACSYRYIEAPARSGLRALYQRTLRSRPPQAVSSL